MIDTYTKWLRECPGADDCLINIAPDNAGFTPYRWKIASADGTVLGQVKFCGPKTNGKCAASGTLQAAALSNWALQFIT